MKRQEKNQTVSVAGGREEFLMCHWLRLMLFSFQETPQSQSFLLWHLCAQLNHSIAYSPSIAVNVQFGTVNWASRMLCHREESQKKGKQWDMRRKRHHPSTSSVAKASGQQNIKNSSKYNDCLGLLSLPSLKSVILQDSNYKSLIRKRTCPKTLLQASWSRFYLLRLKYNFT